MAEIRYLLEYNCTIMISVKATKDSQEHYGFQNGGIAMVTLNIWNMKNFLQKVNMCSSEVNLLYPDGRKENINKQYGLQNRLLQQHRENNNHLQLSLDIPDSKDYISVVSYYVGNI